MFGIREGKGRKIQDRARLGFLFCRIRGPRHRIPRNTAIQANVLHIARHHSGIREVIRQILEHSHHLGEKGAG